MGPINIFTTGGGYAPSRDSKGSGGALIAWHEIHSDIQYKHHAISGLLEPALAWIATRKLFIFHNAMVPTATS